MPVPKNNASPKLIKLEQRTLLKKIGFSSQILYTFALRRPKVANFAGIIKIATFKNSKKCNLYLYFLI